MTRTGKTTTWSNV
ncbi:hypothetical protein LINPERPRIM_LOCUS24794 [Linum perenne]